MYSLARRRMIRARMVYATGDPGLGGLFKKIKKKISFKNIMKVAPFLPVPGAAALRLGKFAGVARKAAGIAKGLGVGAILGGGAAVGSQIVQGIPGFAGGTALPGTGELPPPIPYGGAAGTTTTSTYVDPRTGEIRQRRKYRRMNPGNFKALNRSIRRVKAFKKAANECVILAGQVKARKRGGKKCR